MIGGNRYLVQFKDVGKEYFVTDCSFPLGKLGNAIAYCEMICDALCTVADGQIVDTSRTLIGDYSDVVYIWSKK